MKELLPWLRLILADKRRLWLGGILMFTTLAAGIGLLALSGWFITATALTGLLLAAGVAAALEVYIPGGGIRFFALARTVSRYAERLYNHDTVLRLLARLRVGYFSQLADTHPARRRRQRSADWLNRLTADIEALDNLYLRLLAPAALALLTTLLVALIMLATAPFMLWSLLPLTTLPPALFWLARRNLDLTLTLGEQQQEIRGHLVDMLEGHQELAATHHWPSASAELSRSAQQLDELVLRAEQASADAQALVQIATQAAVLTALILGLWLWHQETLSGPLALMFAVGLFGLAEAYINLPAAFARTGQTLGAARRLNRDAGAQPPGDTPCPDQPVAGPGTLTVHALTRRIQGEALFPPVSFTLQAGERLAIIGPSGCGKSSILEMIAGTVSAPEGQVTLDGQAVGDGQAAGEGSHQHWLKHISYLQQSSWFFNTTVAGHLRLARPEATDEALWEVLQAVALDKRVKTLDTPLGDQGSEFSGGELRRLALARALLKPASILLLDEPFTGLDRQTIEIIRPRLEPWLTNRICIAVAHDLAALPFTDRRLMLP